LKENQNTYNFQDKYLFDIRQGNKPMAEIKFEITKKLGVLSESSKDWKKELNLIIWNDKDPKYDVRDWSPEHDKMGKGVTLSNEELKKLKEILKDIDL
jgi:hypothetical protein